MLPDKILLDFSSAKVEKQYVHLKSFLKKSLGKLTIEPAERKADRSLLFRFNDI